MKKQSFLLICLLCYSVFSFSQDFKNDIRQSALTFIDSLSLLQKKRVMFDFSDTARVQWNNLPIGLRARSGLSIGSLTDEQRKLVHRILSASLSSQGYLKATSIMHLDNLLNIYIDTMYKRNEMAEGLYKRLTDLK